MYGTVLNLGSIDMCHIMIPVTVGHVSFIVITSTYLSIIEQCPSITEDKYSYGYLFLILFPTGIQIINKNECLIFFLGFIVTSIELLTE